MAKSITAMDSRRLSAAVDRLDAVSATDREKAARHVFDVCVYHVTRVRKIHPGPSQPRGNGRLSSIPVAPTAALVFDIVHPHVYRIARRLDRAMRHAEISPHPADAAALIVAVDAQGALAALFAVAQNAGVDPTELEQLAIPCRKRSAPALLRTLFSPDMRVANAAKKALRQVAAIASCQATPWMTSIRAALELRSAERSSRSSLLRGLLSRLAEILHLVVKQAAVQRGAQKRLAHKRSSRSSFGALILQRPRPSLNSERRAADKKAMRAEKSLLKMLFGGFIRNTSKLTEASLDGKERTIKRRFRTDGVRPRRSINRADSVDDMHSVASGAFSAAGSFPGSVFSNVTESGAVGAQARATSQMRRGATIKRDAATAMYIFERLLAKRINPDLGDRVEVISTLADVAQVTFSKQYATSHKIEEVEEYSDAMADVFTSHGQRIYAVVLEILFRPVREADANRIGVFSFHETGITDFRRAAPFTRRKLAEFPQSAICLPNMDCTGLAAVSCNSLLKVFLRFVPGVCAQRLALLTGTINSAFLHASEALHFTEDGCLWEVSKIVSAVDALTVLVAVIPSTTDYALELVIREPVTLRLVIETCIRSVSATGRLLAQNAARSSAPRLSDEGTLDSLRSWQALIRIVPGTSSSWTGTPSYSSSILFLAQVTRRAALISVLQGYRKERCATRAGEDNASDEAYPSVSTLNSTGSGTALSMEDSQGSEPSSFVGNGVGFEVEDENILTQELHLCITAMINVSGINPVDVFFELYRTIVYLYATDLKKTHLRLKRDVPSTSAPRNEGATKKSEGGTPIEDQGPESATGIGILPADARSQSDEEAKGILVENIAVDGELPSRALRRAVMASELDLGEYFDGGQPLSLQHLSPHQTGLPPGMHTFEEFSHALAIIIGALSNKTITEKLECPHEAAQLIARDVQRSGSAYLKRIHKRARSILRKDTLNQDYDWRAERYEERIRKLEEEVASLKSMVQHSIEQSLNLARRKSLPKILGWSGDSQVCGRQPPHESRCGPSRCFCSD